MIHRLHRGVPARRSSAEIRAHDLRKLWTLIGLVTLLVALVTAGQLIPG